MKARILFKTREIDKKEADILPSKSAKEEAF